MMYGVLGITSSRVSATRPGRPMAGGAAKRSTAVRMRSIMHAAAAGLSASRRKYLAEYWRRRGVTAAATAAYTAPRPLPRTALRRHRARRCRPRARRSAIRSARHTRQWLLPRGTTSSAWWYETALRASPSAPHQSAPLRLCYRLRSRDDAPADLIRVYTFAPEWSRNG